MFKYLETWITHVMEKLYPMDAPKLPVQPTSIPQPVVYPDARIQPVQSPRRLEIFCNAITAYEGGPGDPNHLNNNPGDCRCSPVGYLAKYGKVGCSPGGFAVFSSWDLGMEYLQNLVNQRATVHPEWTFLEFFQNYAPSGDKNSPDLYAAFVAKRCGVSVTCTLKQYFS